MLSNCQIYLSLLYTNQLYVLYLLRPNRYIKIILPLFFLIGCSYESDYTPEIPEYIAALENLVVHNADSESSDNITLRIDAIIEETDDVHWGRIIRELTVDEQGRVFIADMASHKIHIYEPNGNYRVSLGREGSGPGEFNTIWRLKTDDKYIHVFDIEHSKISLYDLVSLNHIRDINVSLPQGKNTQPAWIERVKNKNFFYRANDFSIHSKDRYLIYFSPMQPAGETNLGQTVEISLFNKKDEMFERHNISSFKSDGTALFLDKRDGGGVWSDVAYKPRARIRYAQGKILYGWDENMLFKVYDSYGNYQFSFYYPFQNAAIRDKDLYAVYMNPDEGTKNILKKYAPETWPAYDGMVVDDYNRLWISTIVNDFEVREWWVIDLNELGKLVGKFRMPRNKNITQVKGGYIYTIEQDVESGLRKVIRYNISFD